jgi:DNA-binding CsgD family transcriptional regulator
LSLGDALARLSIGVFLLDGLRRIVFSNPYAEHVLGDGLMVTGMKLAAQFASDRAALDAEIAAKTANDTEAAERDPRPIVIQRMRAERPLIVYVLPVRPSENPLIDNFLARSRAIVLVIDPQPGEPADPAAVRDLLGLTMGEARVAALVGSGLPPRSAAEKLGISEETARTALKRVFLKVGVSRQSELSALLTKLVLH